MIPIKFSVNIVIPPGVAGPIGRFLQAGYDSPFHSLDEVPPSLRGFVVQSSDEDSEPDGSPLSLNYTLNTVYAVDANDRRRAKGIEREIIRLERAQEEQRYWEEALSAEPSEQVKAAMEIVQQDHELSVARDTAIATARARERDLSNEFAQRAIDEDQNDDAGYSVSPSIEGEQNDIPT